MAFDKRLDRDRIGRPTAIGDLLGDIVKSAGTNAKRADLRNALAEAMGESMMDHCKISGFRAGKLWVEVDSAPLYSELAGFRREEIRDAMNRTLQKDKVAQLIFRMGSTGHA